MTELPYERWAQEGLRLAVKNALIHVQKNGLPARNKIYISFLTTYPGVDIPKSLALTYPKEMTILIQDNFWNLKVEEKYFCVGLNFLSSSYDITVPFLSMLSFMDPVAEWGQQFKPELDAFLVENIAPEPEAPAPKENSKILRLDLRKKPTS